MSRSSRFAASLLAASIGSIAVLTGEADAASLGNRDENDRKVTIVEPSGSKEHVLKPGAMLQGVCAKGCVVRLGEGTDREYELDSQHVERCEEDCRVEIEIQVVEGQPVLVRSVDIVGLDRVPRRLRSPIEASNILVVGERWDEDTYERTKRAIQIALANGSYAHALVHGRVEIDPHARTADVRIEIDPGGVESRLGELHGERQSDITEADHTGAGAARPNLFPKGIRNGRWHFSQLL